MAICLLTANRDWADMLTGLFVLIQSACNYKFLVSCWGFQGKFISFGSYRSAKTSKISIKSVETFADCFRIDKNRKTTLMSNKIKEVIDRNLELVYFQHDFTYFIHEDWEDAEKLMGEKKQEKFIYLFFGINQQTKILTLWFKRKTQGR